MTVQALALLASPAAVFAEGTEKAATERVEISFKVGDSVLMVNGNELEVTAPYVVGDGTTLVPVRVITEAFGAEVGWDGDTKAVSLSYPDATISLTIGSASATVNSHTEQLSAAPELYNDTTMVPLRFISETFDAVVTYDDATRLITVVKDPQEEQSLVLVGTDRPYVGDSYYGWSMKNPTMLQMEYRSFDGMKTYFADDEAEMAVYIDELEEDITEDEIYENELSLVENMTMSIADRTTDAAGNLQLHFRAKNSDLTIDLIAVVKDEMIYRVISLIGNGAENIKDILEIASSFTLSSVSDMYDMSNVEDGHRNFNNDEFKLSLELPADYYQMETEKTNVFYFLKNGKEYGTVAMEVYSKNDEVTAEASAQEDHDKYVAYSNPELSEVSELSDTTILGMPAKQYTVKYNGGGTNGKFTVTDIFFEMGSYVYNITCAMISETEIKEVIDSFKAEELDPDTVGTILKSASLDKENTADIGSKEITLPKGWSSLDLGSSLMISNEDAAALIGVIKIEDVNRSQFQELLSQMTSSKEESISEGADDMISMKRIKNLSSSTIGGRPVYSVTIMTEYDTDVIYDTLYGVLVDGDVYIFDYNRQDINYSSELDKEVETMIASIK